MLPSELELLSPAGSMDALRAAIANGADAVYLGAAAFGARASAGFDEEALRQALALCHLHRKKIYVTVNILVKERELKDVRRTLSLLSVLGADAVLVQDLGILKICREEYPELPVHASTQMAIHNGLGVETLKKLGVRRAVLARECDLNAIRQAAEVGLEIEAFCHGALCVSCSGQCLFSSMIGGRSGNRGRCAQPCRLQYQYQGHGGALLSPRDLCARDELDQMAQAGVYSFKIEGRLKRPEYVAVVTRAYRQALDAILENRFQPASAQEKEQLTQIFSRGGFTPGYPGRERDAAIIDPRRVTPVGVELGEVKKVYQKGGTLLGDVLLARPLHNGDGLEIGDQQLRYSGPEMPRGTLAALRLRDRVKPGETVRRTEDESQLSAARKTYEGGALDTALPLPVDAVLTAYPGKPCALQMTDGESAVTVTGDVCQPAQSRALDAASARRSLEKTGGTPFVLKHLEVKTAAAFLPASALNALRREALAQLTQARIAAQPRQGADKARFSVPDQPLPAPRLIVKTQRAEEIPDLLGAGAHLVLFQPQDFRPASLEASLAFALSRAPKEKIRLCLPSQCTKETQDMLEACSRRLQLAVCLSSPNQLGGFSRGDMAGEGIPVMNGEALRMLAHLGCRSATLSRELSRQDAMDLPQGVCELILPVYGRARLMLLNHCPMRTALGLKTGREQCDLCARGQGALGTALADRLGARYPLMPLRLPEGCQIGLLAAQPTDLTALLPGLPPLSYLVDLTDEGPQDRLQITRHFAALLRGQRSSPLAGKTTLGRFADGVL